MVVPLRITVVVCLALFSAYAVAAVAAEGATPEDVVAAAFKAVLADDFEAYLVTLHPEERETKTQKDHVKRYQWKRFRKSATRYLQEKRPDSFAVARKEVDGDRVVLYVQDRTQPERMPVPVRLRRTGKSWGIEMNSL